MIQNDFFRTPEDTALHALKERRKAILNELHQVTEQFNELLYKFKGCPITANGSLWLGKMPSGEVWLYTAEETNHKNLKTCSLIDMGLLKQAIAKIEGMTYGNGSQENVYGVGPGAAHPRGY